ncbi:type IV pilus modification protein PilV [Stagnimonas aquatica]|uniref:Type IV pilus modification protein PilV n=1 Tax=Stagnimonas aquatica TaxID=2689987 RepID=A0A3N0V9J7_9GAMM|nr:type IV pilus modification protein PilV [Stagnimonas aquatica]
MPIPSPVTASETRCAGLGQGAVLGRAQGGAGLVEVLVAVLVLSIGLLGIALVQSRSLSSNNSSMTRSMAVAASYSILDSMRADRAQAVLGAYNHDNTAPLKANDCPAAGSSLASRQLNLWCSNELAARLGESAEAEIVCDAQGVCTVTITFFTLDCGRAGDGQTNDALCTQTLSEGRGQRIFTQAML